jgi:hypothetical protein
MNCQEFEERYWLKLYGEAIPGGESSLTEHLEACEACQSRKAEIDRIHALLTVREPVIARREALMQARQLLKARIQSERKLKSGWSMGDRIRTALAGLSAPRWQPAVALVMLVIGLFIGRAIFYAPPLELAGLQPLAFDNPEALERYYIADRILEEESSISDIRVKPVDQESGLVQVSFKGTKDFRLQGSPEDEVIRELMTWAIKNEQNSGARLQSVQNLANMTELSDEAREALAYALTHDENDGVRLRALEALASAPRDHMTEQAILGALLKDQNPAVRIHAIDMLLTKKQTDKTKSLMLSLAEADSNDYVRMRARQAIKESEYKLETVDFQE